MANKPFVYVTYIHTTPEKAWAALTQPECTRKYFMGTIPQSDWKPGSPWKLTFIDGSSADTGEIIECDPPRRLKIKFLNENVPQIKALGWIRMGYTIEPQGAMVKLTITADADSPKLNDEGSPGRVPFIASSLKTFLETGAGLPGTDVPPPPELLQELVKSLGL